MRVVSLRPGILLACFLALPASAQDAPSPDPQAPLGTLEAPLAGGNFLIPAGTTSGLPLVQPNDNRVPAGRDVDGVRVVDLVVTRADWRVETGAGPGIRVSAIAEEGELPSVPAPLIRVETGTRIRVAVRNDLETFLSVVGLHDRPDPASMASPAVVHPGETATFEFEAGPVGTYMYAMWEGPMPTPETESDFAEQTQLAGALVVDPVGGPLEDDRIMVINIFGHEVSEDVHPNGYIEGVAINGRSWPYTERMQLEVGKKERWRVVNASIRNHPMHLHGFYFNVLSRGQLGADDVYEDRDRRLVVTEFMRAFETMLMEWTPTRPGRWLFHCHLSFHVHNEIRLPGAAEADPEHAHSHMAGLVMGLEVAPGPTDLISEGEPVSVDLFAKVYGEETGNRFGFALTSGAPGVNETDAPGPLLVFNQHQTANVTVHNELGLSTGVHWHGLELDGWADGVPGWSASDGMVSPAIPPGESFTYKLSMMRPGTFMYHTHMDDLVQLAGGLYGPLIVLPKGESYDPRYDHIKIFGWRTSRPQGPSDFELNGLNGDPDAVATVGETHRFRVINIAPAGNITAWITRDGEPYPMRLHAKDGADLPEHQRVEAESLPRIGVGETSDFTWTPTEPGVYEIRVGFGERLNFVQRWTVVAQEN